jgi:hypothetical protein
MELLLSVPNLETGSIEAFVVVRKSTIAFWQACIDACERSIRVCAVGTPGIGKTTTTPVLIQMLLETKRTVVYRIVRYQIFEFSPTEHGGFACSIYNENQLESITSLQSRDTYYIVDPSSSKARCDPTVAFKPKVILVTSPDPTVWGRGEFSKQRGPVQGVFRYYPCWTLPELEVAAPYFSLPVPTEVVQKRFLDVGGVPRNVFCNDFYFAAVIKNQETASSDIGRDVLKSLFKQEIDDFSMSDSSLLKSFLVGINPMPGTNFAAMTAGTISRRVEMLLRAQYYKFVFKDEIENNIDGW